jgi:hypothetical protein
MADLSQPLLLFGVDSGGEGGQEAQASAGASVVLFPVEPLRFRSRWDKTAYAWGVFMRDMHGTTYRQGWDRRVSAVALAAA